MAAYLKRTASAEMRSAQYRQMGRRRRRRVLLFPLLLGLMLFLGGFLLGAARAVVEEQEEPAVEQTVEALPLSPASTVKVQTLFPASAVKDQTLEHAASAQEGDWQLRLVSAAHPLPEDFEAPKLTKLRGGHAIDSRAYPALQQMMDDCRAAGLNPVICSSYRTHDKQEELFQKKVNTLLRQGYSQEEAETEAARWVARPGTSEHETGLAVDIVDKSYQLLDEKQEQTPVQQWLMAHCAEYGFILRYSVEKSDLTGIGYEPWHYRYVGVEAAKAITEQGLCLEEYWMGQTEPLQQEYSVQAAPDPVETQG